MAVDADARGAIVALELEPEAELQRGVFVRFGHDAGVFREDRWEQVSEPLSQRGRRTIWRGEKEEVVVAVVGPQVGERIEPADLRLDAQGLEVVLDRFGVAVDEGGVRSPAA